MAISDFVGVSYERDSSGVRPIPLLSTSPIFLIGTAPYADKSLIPEGRNILLNGDDLAIRAALGEYGTLPWALDAIFDQANAQVIVHRVPRSPKPKTTVFKSCRNPLLEVIGEIINRSPDGLTDPLANSDVNAVSEIWSGDKKYTRGESWRRIKNGIEWITFTKTETVQRRTSTTDPLDFQSHTYIMYNMS